MGDFDSLVNLEDSHFLDLLALSQKSELFGSCGGSVLKAVWVWMGKGNHVSAISLRRERGRRGKEKVSFSKEASVAEWHRLYSKHEMDNYYVCKC